MTAREPKRVRLSRRKGYRKPPDAVVVARPSQWANPHRVGDPHPRHGRPMSRQEAVEEFRRTAASRPEWITAAVEQLAGHDLACWCPLDEPCHADVLLEIANGDQDSHPETSAVSAVDRFRATRTAADAASTTSAASRPPPGSCPASRS